MKPNTAKYFHDAGIILMNAVVDLRNRVEALEKMQPAPSQKRLRFAIDDYVTKDGSRTIRGIASTASVDRVGDVVRPLGCTWKLPIVLLRDHDHGRPVGKLDTVHLAADGVRITASLAQGLPDADATWSLIQQKVLQSFSIGFKGIESKPLPTGGVEWLKWEMLELSVVSVPANPDAIISEVAA